MAAQAKHFNWAQEETAFPPKVTLDYKTAKLAEAKDCEIIRAKYEGLTTLLIEQYPVRQEGGEDFPRSKNAREVFSKDRINARLKKSKQSLGKLLTTEGRAMVAGLSTTCMLNAPSYG